MNNPQLSEASSSRQSISTTDDASTPPSVVPESYAVSSPNVTQEELLKTEYVCAYNSLLQAEAKLEQNPRNRIAQKDRAYWLDQIEEIRKNIAENGQSSESVQATVKVAQTKVTIQQQSKTQTYCIGALVFLAALFTFASLYCVKIGENALGTAFFCVLCCLLFGVFLGLLIVMILRYREKRNR